MSFSERAWSDAADIVAAIGKHPFLAGVADGTLAAERFRYYMAQDALYLTDYGRMLALAASQATRPDEIEFWSASAVQAVVVERQLHAEFVTDLAAASKSPTCTAYTSFHAALGARGSYPALAAGLLPCFWVYAHVGEVLSATVSDLGAHPYGSWIRTYADPAFAAASEQARQIVDRAVAAAGVEAGRQAAAAFRTACRYEWMFWDAAWRLEAWPV